MNGWLGLFILFLGLGLALLWLARRGHARSGLPHGRLVYTDVGAWHKVERPLFSDAHQLTGRPDYLVAEGQELIPVEVKTGSTPLQPYRSHVLQLAAYCLLIEANYGRRPSYGVVAYTSPHRVFALDYTRALEHELLATLERMRGDLAEGDADRSHADPRRCIACGYRDACDQALA
jgi:CRISPR-associated exonuclease Cas4